MTPLDKAARWMTAIRSDAVDRLERWCNQNSWSHDPVQLAMMSSLLCEDFRAIGVDFEVVELQPLRLLGDDRPWVQRESGPGLLWHHNPDAPMRILLMIHYDTVYPTDSLPDRCQRHGNRLVGPGVIDAKGGIAVIAMATEAVLKFELANDIGFSVFLNPDEEIGSSASRPRMKKLAHEFDAALLFEPSLPNGALVAARKGTGNFSLIIDGKSAHSGRNPEDGRNAIVHASKLVPELTALHDPSLGVLLNIGRVAGGGPLNQVPDHAVMQLNIRVVDVPNMQRVENRLQEIAQQFTYEQYRVSVNGEFHCPPKPVDDATVNLQRQVERAGAIAGRSVCWQNTGGACDGNKLAAMGLPNIDTMGMSGSGMHSAEETCELDSLVPAAHTVAALIAGFGDTESH